MPRTDLFGDNVGGGLKRPDAVVRIRDNEILERACNRIIAMVRADDTLLDGSDMATIDAQIFAEVVWADCFQKLITAEKKDVFIQAMRRAPSQEVYSRARRELLSRDIVRVSAKAIRSSEQHRARIAGAMR